MSNPVSIDCIMGQWTLVATSVTSGNVLIQQPNTTKVLATYRMTGDTAPTVEEDHSARTHEDCFTISSTSPIDVYLFPLKNDIKAVVSV